MAWLKHMLTGIDNHTFDIARMALLLGILSVIGFTAFDAIHEHHAFNPINFATAYTAIVAGICGGIWWKRDTEPKGVSDAQTPA